MDQSMENSCKTEDNTVPASESMEESTSQSKCTCALARGLLACITNTCKQETRILENILELQIAQSSIMQIISQELLRYAQNEANRRQIDQEKLAMKRDRLQMLREMLDLKRENVELERAKLIAMMRISENLTLIVNPLKRP